jgi:hypothetical protein
MCLTLEGTFFVSWNFMKLGEKFGVKLWGGMAGLPGGAAQSPGARSWLEPVAGLPVNDICTV